MSYGGFYEYVPVEKKKERARRAVEKLKKKNADIQPVIVEGRTMVRTWWGKAWNANLESYADYDNRLGRGRSYLRHGSVLDLKISKGRVEALVQGSSNAPYKIVISISPLSEAVWEKVKLRCQGQIHSLQELLAGKIPATLSGLLTAHDQGLFPSPREITISCSCPDWASLCKHSVSVLYGVGVRLDADPLLFFTLRGQNAEELVATAVHAQTQSLLNNAESSRSSRRRTIEPNAAAQLFGIEMRKDSAKMPVTQTPQETPHRTPVGRLKTKPRETPKSSPENATLAISPSDAKEFKNILAFCSKPRSRSEIAEKLGLTSFPYVNAKYLTPLITSGKLRLTLPEAPRSKFQKFVSVK